MELNPSGNEYYTFPSKYYAEPFEILPRLYYVGDQRVCMHLIDTGDGLILFDAGFPHAIHLLTESIYRIGYNPKDIRYLILSHGHFDHTGAAAEYRTLYGVKTCIGKADYEMFRDRPELALYSHGHTPYADVPPIDIPLEDGARVALGDIEIECVSTPGHTMGVMSFFFQMDGHCVGYFGGVGFNTLATRYYKEFNLEPNTRDLMRASFDKVYDRPVDVMLGNHPGQNGTFKKYEAMKTGTAEGNPFVHAGEWQHRIDHWRAGLDELDVKDPLPKE